MNPIPLRVLTALILVTAVALTAPGGADAQSKAKLKRLGTFNAWSSYVLEGRGTLVCYMHSEPEKMTGDYTRRGDSFLQITHRPKEKIANEVGLTAGYAYRKNSEVIMEIDGKATFKLFTNGDGAWARDSKTDTRLVRALSRGSELVVHGVSGRGTKTVDTYSLSGFTAAYRAIGKACKG